MLDFLVFAWTREYVIETSVDCIRIRTLRGTERIIETVEDYSKTHQESAGFVWLISSLFREKILAAQLASNRLKNITVYYSMMADGVSRAARLHTSDSAKKTINQFQNAYTRSTKASQPASPQIKLLYSYVYVLVIETAQKLRLHPYFLKNGWYTKTDWKIIIYNDYA